MWLLLLNTIESLTNNIEGVNNNKMLPKEGLDALYGAGVMLIIYVLKFLWSKVRYSYRKFGFIGCIRRIITILDAVVSVSKDGEVGVMGLGVTKDTPISIEKDIKDHVVSTNVVSRRNEDYDDDEEYHERSTIPSSGLRNDAMNFSIFSRLDKSEKRKFKTRKAEATKIINNSIRNNRILLDISKMSNDNRGVTRHIMLSAGIKRTEFSTYNISKTSNHSSAKKGSTSGEYANTTISNPESRPPPLDNRRYGRDEESKSGDG